MNNSSLLWVIVGGAVVYFLLKPTFAPAASASTPVMNSLLSKPATPAPAGQQWQWNGFQWVTVPIGAVAM